MRRPLSMVALCLVHMVAPLAAAAAEGELAQLRPLAALLVDAAANQTRLDIYDAYAGAIALACDLEAKADDEASFAACCAEAASLYPTDMLVSAQQMRDITDQNLCRLGEDRDAFWAAYGVRPGAAIRCAKALFVLRTVAPKPRDNGFSAAFFDACDTKALAVDFVAEATRRTKPEASPAD